MDKISKYIKWVLVGVLYLILLTPLLITSKYVFPFITGKTMFFRILIEVAVLIYVVLAILNKKYRPKMNKLIWAVVIFGIIVSLTTFLGVDAYKSFWGTIERGEGFLTISHLIIFFLILSWTFKTKQEWFSYLTGLVVAGLLIVLYAILQRAEVENFFLFGNIIHSGEGRLSATLGNAAFLGAYTLAQFFVSLLLFLKRKHILWKIFFAFSGLVNLYILYQTQTRGAAIGLGVVSILLFLLYIIKSPDRIKRIIAGALLLIIVLFSLTVWFNRDAEWVKKAPMLERLTSISESDITTQSRLMAWDTSWKGWKDRFLLGYGWENYNIAFNKYFHPEIYIDNGSQLWFDRAHNTIFDIAVATGIIGLIAYVNIFVLALLLLFKNLKRDFDFSAILIALLVAHFIQNIFVFDVLSTFITLFTVFAVVSYLGNPNYGENEKPEKFTNNFVLKITIILVTLTLVILSIEYFNLKPLRANEKAIQGLMYGSSQRIPEAIKYFGESIDMGTYQSQEIRRKVADIVINNSQVTSDMDDTKKAEIMGNFKFVIEQIEDNIREHPSDVQDRMYLMMALNRSGYFNPNNFAEVVRVGKKALTFSPTRAHIYFEMGQAEMNQGHAEEGIGYFKKAVELNPKTMESQWNLMTAYSLVGQQNKVDEVRNNMEELGYVFIETSQFQRIYTIYARGERYDKMAETLEKILELEPSVSGYTTLASVYKGMGDYTKAVETAKKAAELDPKIQKDVDKFINSLHPPIPLVEEVED
ncbi:MAG: O-antigen ligase family protein [Patescibacteria group bacterium]